MFDFPVAFFLLNFLRKLEHFLTSLNTICLLGKCTSSTHYCFNRQDLTNFFKNKDHISPIRHSPHTIVRLDVKEEIV